MYGIKGKVTGDHRKIRDQIRKQAGAIILKHALGMASATYAVYPVGPPHKDNTPHTRDTFQIVKGDNTVLAEKGNFKSAKETFEVSNDPKNRLSFLAKGASFFLEFGTVNMDPRPIIRRMIRMAQAGITKDLRKMNLRHGR